MNGLKAEQADILVIAIGNCGRNDDGLGWKFAETASQTAGYLFDVEYRYQLQVEDAELVSKYNIVLFADASQAPLQNGFELNRCKKAMHYFYSSHLQTPETVLYLCETLYHKYPEASTIAIQGKNWGLGTTLSKEAEKNLNRALAYFEQSFLPSIQPVLPVDQ